MAQLRQDYDEFTKRQVQIIVIGPDNVDAFSEYWQNNKLPFTGIPDPHGVVLKLYGQEIKIFKFGRMPAQVIVDKKGIARFVHYGNSMSDIPSNEEILKLIDGLNMEEGVVE